MEFKQTSLERRTVHIKSLIRHLILPFVILYTIVPWAAEPPAQSCDVPQLPASNLRNLFNDEQEVMLGDVMAAIANDSMESIDDPEITAYLQELGERIVRHLPPSHLQYRFYLADFPVANALSMSGGRVYVTRKLVASAREEDELAGVIGHELGHIITHQQAIDWTMYLNKALGVTSVSDRKDIEEKVERVLFESQSRWGFGAAKTKPDIEEQDADRVGMEAVVRAGYRPDAIVDFFDRMTENKGKKGSWLSELLQTTTPNVKRYREMLKLLPKISTRCIETRRPNGAQEFSAWKSKVVAYRGTGRRESIHNTVLKRELDPPLQDELHTLRFSPDGKLLLAQDSGTVYVARRDPLQVIFRFEAPNAQPAMFTPDNTEVIVYDQGMRIERWDIESQQRVDVYEVSSASGCMQIAVSPDGNTLACLDRKMTLALIDAETNERFFERKEFHRWTLESAGYSWKTFRLSAPTMSFSPDGRYFLASSGTSKPVAYDLRTHGEMNLPRTINDMLTKHFTFLGPDRIAGVVGTLGYESRVVRFPTGEVLNHINTGNADVSAAAHGEYLLLRPVEGYAAGALDINQNKLVRANKKRAFDVYDDVFVSELGSGEIALFQQSATPIAMLKLPRGRLGNLQAGVVSPDLRWLAISAAGRGAVWDLSTGAQLYNVKGFQGAYIGADNSLYVDFPKQDKTPRNVVRLGLQTRGMALAYSLGEDERATEHSAFLTRVKPIEQKPLPEGAKLKEEVLSRARGDFQRAHYVDMLHQPARHVILDVQDTQTGTLLWSRRFEDEMPWIDFDGDTREMVLRWHYNDDGARAALRDASEKQRLHGEPGDYLLEVVDVSTGKVRGTLLVPTSKGMFSVKHAVAAGDRVFVTDSRSRVLVYSLKDGSLTGHMFGTLRAVSSDGSRFCVQHDRAQLTIYDAATLSKLDKFSFAHTITTVQFEGRRLFVLTADQTAYGLELQ